MLQYSNQDQIDYLVDRVVAVDIETTPIKDNGLVDKVWCISWDGNDGTKGSVFWPEGVSLSRLALEFKQAAGNALLARPGSHAHRLLDLRKVLSCEDGYVPAFHNASFDKKVLSKCIHIPKYYCTMQLAYCVMPPSMMGSTGDEDALRFYSLAALARCGLCSSKAEYDNNWNEYSTDMLEYNIQDAASTYELYKALVSLLDESTWGAYKIDMCCLEMVINFSGCTIDANRLQEVFLEKEEELREAKERLWELVPCVAVKTKTMNSRPVNTTSIKRGIYPATDVHKYVIVGEGEGLKTKVLLVEKFDPAKSAHVVAAMRWVHGWTPSEFSRAGNPKMDKTILEPLAEEFEVAYHVMKVRRLSKLLSTYLLPYKEKTDEFNRLFPSFPLCATRTGRLASRKPNFQNVPKDATRRLIVAPEGMLLVCIDLSQIELRILAWYMFAMLGQSHDSAGYLWNAYHARRDVHNENQEMMGLSEDPDGRRKAKIGKFLYIYGGREHRMSKSLSISMDEARRILTNLEKNVPALPALVNTVVGMAKTQKVLRTKYGHKITYPDLTHKDYKRVAAAERQYFNALIQGTQADVIKILMWQTRRLLVKHGASMLLQVHDELVFQVPTGNVRHFCEGLMPIFNNEALLPGLPIEGVPGVGHDWYTAKEDGSRREDEYKASIIEGRKVTFEWPEGT